MWKAQLDRRTTNIMLTWEPMVWHILGLTQVPHNARTFYKNKVSILESPKDIVDNAELRWAFRTISKANVINEPYNQQQNIYNRRSEFW